MIWKWKKETYVGSGKAVAIVLEAWVQRYPSRPQQSLARPTDSGFQVISTKQAPPGRGGFLVIKSGPERKRTRERERDQTRERDKKKEKD